MLAADDPLLKESIARATQPRLIVLERALQKRACAIRRRDDMTFAERQAALEPYVLRRQEVLNEIRRRRSAR